jgi:hypothetical protein
VNDAAPGRARHYRLTGTSTPIVTGLVAGFDGEERFARNVAGTSVVFNNADAGSTAANRFANSTGANITLAQNEWLHLLYDATDARWIARKV